MRLNVLYRGPLSSCNYACGYCPFAKRKETTAELRADRAGLTRFLEFLRRETDREWGVLFTPWGEALVRGWYRRAMRDLSQLDHLKKVAIQTNLSAPLDWVADCRHDRLGFWATYHPTEVARDVFVSRVERLWERGISLSVGAVGVPSRLAEIAALRSALPAEIYLWVNAERGRRRKYTVEELRLLKSIDPLFEINLHPHRTRGAHCLTGETSFTVDGDGNMRRCHFVDEVIGNIDDQDWSQSLRHRLCPNTRCDCHIGYVHLPALGLVERFGEGLLERNPLAKSRR